MRSLDFGRYALTSCVATAMLAGCGGSQPPIGAPGAMPQTAAITTRAERGTSWMLPEAKTDDLLYASNQYGYGPNGVFIFSYKRGKQHLSFQGPNARARTTTVNLNFGHASSPHRTEHLSRLASLAPNTCRTERNREFKPPVREGRRWRQQLRA
jgi:hypothetical protein